MNFYALSDSFTGPDPREHTYGFANTKEVIIFSSKKARDEWVKNTKLMTARILSRDQARKHITSRNGKYLAISYSRYEENVYIEF